MSKNDPTARAGSPLGAMTRILYFDIDGVLLDYEDKPKPALVGNVLPPLLEARGFQKVVCVSGWCDMVREPTLRIPPSERIKALHTIVAPVFPNLDWFAKVALLTNDTDHRCKHIDLNADWFYVDDWADKFFTEQFGEMAYKQWIGSRILCCDPYGDGTDLIEWLTKLMPFAPTRTD